MLDLGLFARSQIRLVRQTEIAECGLASIAMIASYHGFDTDIAALRRRFSPSLRGTNIRSLMAIADGIGLTPRAVKLSLDDLGSLQIPCVLHWDMNHYVVLEKIKRGPKGRSALIHNPEGHSIMMPIEEVSRHFTGVALELRPSEDFAIGGERQRLRLFQLWNRTNGLKRAILQTLVLTLVLQAYVLALPYYSQIAIDTALPTLDLNLLLVLAIGFALFTILNAGAEFLRSYVVLVAGTTLGYTIAANIARRLFRLPIDWFERRHTGDILSRFQSVTPIKDMLAQGAAAAIVDGLLAILTLALMFWYSALLAVVAVVAFALFAIIRLALFSAERDAQEGSIINRGEEQTILIETLRGMTTLRLFGRESLRHAFWQTKLTDAVNSDVRLARVGIWQMTANALIFGIENVVTLYLAISFVIDGAGFSLGMVFAYMAYKAQFVQKSATLIESALAFRMLGLHLERLSDIALNDEDISFGESYERKTKLIGELELRDIFYRYAPTDPVILQGLNLKVQQGEFVAITGQSGEGKSTLVKVMLGLVEPENGEVLVDGLPLSRFGHKSYHQQIASVLQEDALFAGTLSSNIALFDEDVDMERVVRSARAAAIHNDILQMPMQYQTLVGDMGSALSGGQKQRILLARALYREPRLLIMDEGTAHLDLEHERAVNAAIKEMGITRIIIAHRKETIEVAERILVMKNGRLEDLK